MYGYQNREMKVFPPVIKWLLIINGVMFFLTYLMSSYNFGDISISSFLYENCALFPIGGEEFGLPSFNIWQLITYQFLHGGLGHIFFNLFALWMFGAEVENLWGGKKFLIYYLLSGVGAGLVQLFISPLMGSVGPTVGASGSLYGIMLAFAMLYPDRSIMIFPLFIPIKAKYVILGLVAYDLILGFTADSNVAHFAHLGGAAMGFLLMKFGDKAGIYTVFDKIFKKKPKYDAYRPNDAFSNPVYTMNWETPKNSNPAYTNDKSSSTAISSININGEEITQVKIDEILDKISSSGYQNLTADEKKILFELSKKIR